MAVDVLKRPSSPPKLHPVWQRETKVASERNSPAADLKSNPGPPPGATSPLYFPRERHARAILASLFVEEQQF